MLASDVITEIALLFVTSEDFDILLNKSLAIIGKQLSISRCSLFIDSADGTTTSNTHEWCAEGIKSQITHLQNIPYSTIPSWKEILDGERMYAIRDVGGLPLDMINALTPLGVRSIILSPFSVERHVRGFLFFGECTRLRAWSKLETEAIRTVSSIITTSYAKKLLKQRFLASEENFRSFFNTVDDIILISDHKGKIVFANEGATRTLGYSLEELRARHFLDLHPISTQEEIGRVLGALFGDEPSHHLLEIETRNGIRIPVETQIKSGQWDGQDCIFSLSKNLSTEHLAHQKFEKLFRSNPAAMAVSSINDRCIIDVNDAFVEKLGYAREEVIGKSSVELGLFVNNKLWFNATEELSRTGSIRNRELTLRCKNGSLIHGLFSGDMVTSQRQKYFLTVMIDITQQIKLQNELTTEHHRLANIIDGTRLGTWEWDVQTGETVFNGRWAEIIGYTLAELAPTTISTWSNLSHPDDLTESRHLLKLHFEGQSDFFEHESRIRHKNGSWVWVLDRGKVIERDKDGLPLKMYGTHADITDRKAMEDRIRELAIHDPLTETYNRRYIFERLEEIVAEYSRRGRHFCVSILDIDHFKSVNDTYGHQAGDLVLKEFSLTASSTIRPYDLLGRYGGEEFIILSTSTSAPETLIVLERIMEAVRSKTFQFEEQEIHFTFSGGLADSLEFAQGAISVEAVISLADKRLYVAKRKGRNQCVGPGTIAHTLRPSSTATLLRLP